MIGENKPKAFCLVKLWKPDSEVVRVGGEVIELTDYIIFAYYMLRYGKLVDVEGLRWCSDIWDYDCVRFSIPCPNLSDSTDKYIYGSVDYVVRARNIPGILMPSKDEHIKLLEEGRIVDLTPEKHLSAFLVFKKIRSKYLELRERIKKFATEVERNAGI